jgi:predicted dehydrogenase
MAAKTRKVNLAVIGVGGMGSEHSKKIKKMRNARLAAVCDVNEETVKKLGEELNVPYFTSHKQLIKSGLCNAAVVAIPHPLRPPVVNDLFKANIHVLSEKPLSERISTAEKMVKEAKKRKLIFAVMFQLRFDPAVVKAMELVKQGKLGTIYRAQLISLKYRTQTYYDSGSWRATWKGEGGGVMMNQSPHIIDVFVQLCGLPQTVYGKIDHRMHNIEVEDTAEAMLRFKNGGSGYVYCTTNESRPGEMIEICGDKGKLIFRDGQLSFYRFNPTLSKHIKTSKEMWSGPDIKQVPLRISNKKTGHIDVIRNFVNNILDGEKLRTPAESGLGSLELANAIMLSSFEDRWITLPISRRKYDQQLSKLRRNSKFVKKNVKQQRVTDPHVKV